MIAIALPKRASGMTHIGLVCGKTISDLFNLFDTKSSKLNFNRYIFLQFPGIFLLQCNFQNLFEGHLIMQINYIIKASWELETKPCSFDDRLMCLTYNLINHVDVTV